MMETMANQMNKLAESNAKIGSDAALLQESVLSHVETMTSEFTQSKDKLTQVKKSMKSHQEQVNIGQFCVFQYNNIFYILLYIIIIINYFSVNLGIPLMRKVLNRHSMVSMKNWNISKRNKSSLVGN